MTSRTIPRKEHHMRDHPAGHPSRGKYPNTTTTRRKGKSRNAF